MSSPEHSPAPPPELARRYAEWIDRHRFLVLGVALAVAIVGGLLASRLPLKPDLSNLLPPSARSVRDLRALQDRAQAFGTVHLLVEADDPALRERAAQALRDRLEAMDGQLVASVIYDDGPARRYFWEHRFLFASLEDLTDARDAIQDRIRQAKLKANPLYIDLEDDGGGGGDGDEELDERVDKLRERLRDAEEQANQPAGFVSEDGRLQAIVLRTTFGSAQFDRGAALIDRLERAFGDIKAELGPEIRFGLTGPVVMSLDENRSVMRGLVTAAIITIVLCALALLLYYRSVLPVMTSLWSLAVGTLATFGIAWLTIGHLNLVTAFLAAIVVGNGINSGLILLARYFEEIRAGREGTEALGGAIAGAARGTAAAALTASVAYGSLIVTDFRGFRHFGIIGGIGMVLCWISAFTVLPAGLSLLWRAGRVRSTSAPVVGRMLARALPKNLDRVAIVGGVLAGAAAVATVLYVLSDPLQEDWSNLRPSGTETASSSHWYDRMKEEFGDKLARGLTQRFVIGVERREDTRAVVELLRHVDDGVPEGKELMSSVSSLDDLVPSDQEQKLALLAEIRTLLDDDLVEEFSEEDRETIEKIRPPEAIPRLSDADVPDELAWPFTEKDGTRGRLIVASGSLRFKTWNIRHRMEFASGFRKLDLPEGTVVGGQSFIFADMVRAMGRDGPLATLAALLGAIVVVWLLVGLGRFGAVTLLCGFAGICGMIAMVSIAGLKVNVIDFIALPITIGLGIDYAVNIAARARQEGDGGRRRLLTTTGGAVLLCSFTTIVGYGSLLLSDSGGIRSFGLAAILGEITCVAAAVALAPSLLALTARRRSSS